MGNTCYLKLEVNFLVDFTEEGIGEEDPYVPTSKLFRIAIHPSVIFDGVIGHIHLFAHLLYP